MRAYNGDKFGMEATMSGDLFEVEIAHNSDRGQIWSFNEEEETKTEFYYRLRHLNSGRLVRPQQVTLLGRKINTLGLADHIDDKNIKELMESSLFKLFSTTVDNDNRIRSGETTKIFSIKTKEYLWTKEDQEWTGGVQGGGGRAQSRAQSRGFQRPKTKGGYDDFIEDPDDVKHEETKGTAGKRNKGKANEIYRPIDDDELNNARNLVVELSPKAANKDAFLISVVSENEVKDLLFVQTVGGNLYTFSKYLRSKKFNEITQDMYSKVIENLSKLIFFVTKTESTDPVRCEGIPIKSRQKLMRELRIIELLVDCLYYPFSSGVFKIKELTNDMPIKIICTLCYRLILHSVKNYKNNELYASQWIDLYFDHSMTSSETNLKAEATIAVLISSNKTLLEKQITRQTIEKFINLSKEQEKDERFITLLGALCSWMEEAIPNNQNNVIELMFENQINKDALNVPIRENGDQVEICIDDESESIWINIKDLKEFSNSKSNKCSLYKY